MQETDCCTLAEIETSKKLDERHTTFEHYTEQELLYYAWEPQDRPEPVNVSGKKITFEQTGNRYKAMEQQEWRRSIAIVAKTACTIKKELKMLRKVYEAAIGVRPGVIPDPWSDSDSSDSES